MSTMKPQTKADTAQKGEKRNKLLNDLQQKWLKAAKSMGGPDAKIVVVKSKAKQIIFDMLHDAFRPFTITEIYKRLNAVVPSPVLKTCLEEMVPKVKGFDDDVSDLNVQNSESEKPSQQDKYTNSLLQKYGRTCSNTLYFANQSLLENGGDGISHHMRNELLALYQKAESKLKEQKELHQKITVETTQLNSELTNDEIIAKLHSLEKELSNYDTQISHARKFNSNERVRLKLLKRRKLFLDYWYQRKTKCTEFLSNMEEWTDGALSAKKCLKGDGQIYIESDESYSSTAMAIYERMVFKRKQNALIANGKRRKIQTEDTITDGVVSPSFVSLLLTGKGRFERIYFKHG